MWPSTQSREELETIGARLARDFPENNAERRLTLVPPGRENLPDLIRLKGDARVFELMLHGVRSEHHIC